MKAAIFTCAGGTGPPLLLLHGFPQTHLMWRQVAPLLARNFSVVCADLRGYGRSGCPATTGDHAPYAKESNGARYDRADGEARVSTLLSVRPRSRRARCLSHGSRPPRTRRPACRPGHPADRGGMAPCRCALRFGLLAVVAAGSAATPSRTDLVSCCGGHHRQCTGPVGFLRRCLSREGAGGVRDARCSSPIMPTPSARTIVPPQRSIARMTRRIAPVVVAYAARPWCCGVFEVPCDAWYQEQGGPLALWRAWADDVESRPLEEAISFRKVRRWQRPRHSATFSAVCRQQARH